MSKRFNGIALSQELGRDIGSNSSVLENNKSVLYAENINSVIYYDKSLNQLNDGEAPTKKYIAPIRDTSDYIKIYVSNFNHNYDQQSFNQWVENFGDQDPRSVISNYDAGYICYPSNPNYRMEWNGKIYYKWELSNIYYNSTPTIQYFITSTADYNTLKHMSMQYAYDNNLGYWSELYKLSQVSVAEFDEDDEDAEDSMGQRKVESSDLRICNVEYYKSQSSTTVQYNNKQSVKYVDINIGQSKESYIYDWVMFKTNTGKRYVCNPGDPEYILNYNGQHYFCWKYYATSSNYWTSNGQKHSYLITTICDYDVMHNFNGEKLSDFVVAEFDTSKEVIKNVIKSETISEVTHFPGLYFKTPTDTCTISFTHYNNHNPNIQYSINYGLNWTQLTGSNSVSFGANEIIWFKGLNPDRFNGNIVYSYFNISCDSSNIEVYGNPLSLVDNGLCTTNALHSYEFYCLFRECSKINKANINLSIQTLATSCYNSMFYGCTGLTEAPELPAQTLTEWCYTNMFQGCTSLTEAPELPAQTLATSCYNSMFYGCTSLTEAPALPAQTLASSCYSYMFNGCTSLTEAPALPAQTLASSCYSYMFNGCTNLIYVNCQATSGISTTNCASWLSNTAPMGTFVKASSASWTVDSPSGIPSGWSSITDIDNSTTNFVSVHILQDNNSTTTESLTITFNSVGTSHHIYTTKTVGNWSSNRHNAGDTITITNSEILYMRGNLYSADVNNYTQIIITSNTGSKAILAGNCGAIWNYNTPQTAPKTFSGFNLFNGSIALYKVCKKFLPATSLTPQCYTAMFRECTNLVNAPNLAATDLTDATYCYDQMFYGCTSLIEAPALPAITLSNYCYNQMFYGCRSLIYAPNLPATAVTQDCYNQMFQDCESIIKAPALPATNLSNASECYMQMFYGCTSLTEAPELPATTISQRCYYKMFERCTNLIVAPALPATILEQECYYRMFYNCNKINKIYCGATTNINTANCWYWLSGVSSTGSFYKSSSATWGSGISAIPTDWSSNVYNANIVSESKCVEVRLISGTPTITFVSVSSNHILQYKDSSHSSLTRAYANDTISMSNSNPIVYLKGTLNVANDENNYTQITITGGEVELVGICNYLWGSNLTKEIYNYYGYKLFYGSTAIKKVSKNFLPSQTLANYCYHYMFYGCTSLTEAPELPAQTLASNCYSYMFYRCTSLTEAPTLPAQTLAPACYAYMFYGCTSLTEAPILPAIDLRGWCYNHMFNSCTSLTEAPALPAQTLAHWCYYYMFGDCTGLTEAPALPAQTLANHCYQNMFYRCTSLTEAPELPATALTDDCYTQMLYGCTSLTKAPALPAQTLVDECYWGMFQGCTSLTEAPVLPAQTLANYCYYSMFYGCTSLTEAPALPAQTLTSYCYYQIFYGTNFNEVICFATDISAVNALYEWLPNTSTGVAYVKNNNISVPSNWTKQTF